MVSFGAIEIRHYLSALGDHPSVSSGVPVGLSDTWEVGYSGALMEYEQMKGERYIMAAPSNNDYTPTTPLSTPIEEENEQKKEDGEEDASAISSDYITPPTTTTTQEKTSPPSDTTISDLQQRRLKKFEKMTLMRLTRVERVRRCLDAGYTEEDIEGAVEEVNAVKLRRFASRPSSLYPDIELQIELGFEEFTHACKNMGKSVLNLIPAQQQTPLNTQQPKDPSSQQTNASDVNDPVLSAVVDAAFTVSSWITPATMAPTTA